MAPSCASRRRSTSGATISRGRWVKSAPSCASWNAKKSARLDPRPLAKAPGAKVVDVNGHAEVIVRPSAEDLVDHAEIRQLIVVDRCAVRGLVRQQVAVPRQHVPSAIG